VGLAERGARVILGDRGDASKTIALIADTGHEAVPVRLDISDRSSIEAARDRVAEELGHVDILVNNAGTFEGATWDELDFDLWQHVMTTDLNGPMLMCKAYVAGAGSSATRSACESCPGCGSLPSWSAILRA
jgi:NAD(P)-dependent dehydrogenase (short-subunit alcohol dehydrogenase family)